MRSQDVNNRAICLIADYTLETKCLILKFLFPCVITCEHFLDMLAL